MINMYEVSETNKMIEHENLDVRTITLGISLLDCIDSDLDQLNQNIYNKITTVAKDLVSTGQDIEKEFGIPIVNKRISITPVSLVGEAARTDANQISSSLYTLAQKLVSRRKLIFLAAAENASLEHILDRASTLLSQLP